MKIHLPRQVKTALQTLEDSGYEAYVVGGCVRDSIMGIRPNDWDICTNAPPGNILHIFRDYKTIKTGMRHGTITVIIDKMPLEITTYRIDGEYEDNRHPVQVQYTRSLKDDLERRDFTINAMAYNRANGLVDYFNGMDDLESKIIRCVGDSSVRFREDALRIMRMFRFSAQLQFSIDPDTAKGAEKRKQLLQYISRERIREEFNKILLVKDTDFLYTTLKYMLTEGFMTFIIPELNAAIDFDQCNPHHDKTVSEHILYAMKYTPRSLVIRLAVLLHDIGKPDTFSVDERGIGHFYNHPKIGSSMARSILMRLRYDKATINKVVTLIVFHDITPRPNKRQVKRLMNRLNPELFEQLLAVKRADNAAKSSLYVEQLLKKIDQIENIYNEIIATGECYSLDTLAVTGNDLISMGFRPGTQIGYILDNLLQQVIDNPELNEKNTLVALAKHIST